MVKGKRIGKRKYNSTGWRCLVSFGIEENYDLKKEP